jgi:hypothetical protein
MCGTASLSLICHPSTSPGAARGVAARVRRTSADVLGLSFLLDGDLARLVIPPPSAPHRGARLWEHTCFEAFIGVQGSPAYHELNLSPSGAYAVYAFTRYREGVPLADEEAVQRVSVRRLGDRLVLGTVVALGRLAAAYVESPLRLGLAAVVEGQGGALSYWALRHPPGRPDFHHADAFALALDPATCGTGASA